MVIIGGEIDLSIGSTIALSSVVTAIISNKLIALDINPTFAVIVGMITAILISALIGLLNGIIRTKYNIPTFIITLAMLNVIYGVSSVVSKGFPIVIKSSWYPLIGAGQLFRSKDFRGIPVSAIWLLIVFFVVAVIMNKMRFGREVYAVGGNPESARLSGINVSKVKIIILVIVQVFAALAGIILSSQVMAGSSQFGKGYEMDVISSVIIGGSSLNGGIGKVWGTFIGIVFLGVILNGMTLVGMDDFVKYIVRGSLILIAVLINTIQLNKKVS